MVDVAAGAAGGGYTGMSQGTEVTPEEVKRVYEEKQSLTATAKALDISRYRVIKILDETGIDRRLGRRVGYHSVKPTFKDRAVETYKRLGTVQKTAAELHTAKERVSEVLKDAGILERPINSTARNNRSKQSYDDIDRWLRLIPGNKVLTPKGPRIISEVYSYYIAVKTKHGLRECFTKGSLLVCATLKAEGLEYREEREK